MPNLYPGIKPTFGNGRPCALLFTVLFLPFFVFAQPVITSFAPRSGTVGSTVTISGSNFAPVPSSNIVFFGSVRAAVTAASATSLTVTVPPGSSYQPLTVTTGGLTAFSAQPFITTFSDPGQFTTQAFSTRTDISTGNGPQSIFSMDMDGDGKPDLVVADGDSNTVEIYRNTSSVGSISYALAVDYLLPPGYYPVAITAGDLDGDGKPEVIVSNYGSPKLAIFRNTSTTGAISFASPIYYALGNYTTGVVVEDCNGDGKPEIVVSSAADNLVSVYANNSTTGSLSFSPKMDLHLPPGTLPFNVIVSDLDGDGKPDLASVNAATNTVSVFRNTGSTGGALSFAANVDFSVGGGPQDLAVGDIDGDGKPDLAVVNNGDATITLLQNTCTSGTISFTRGTDVPTGASNPGSPWALVLADFDGDGKPDIASINQLDNTVSLHRNTSTVGTLSIAANVDYATGTTPWFLTTADMDGDGLPDLAIIDNTTAKITLLRNKSSTEPSITSFTPSSGAAGTVVTITGTNLTGATAVSFGGVAATSFTVVSSTTVKATVGAGATGVVSIVTPSGTASSPGLFTYGVPSPSITSFSPNSGSPGTTVTIKGSHFTGVTNVSFGGVAAASFTVVSDSSITAVVGNGGTGFVVTTAGTRSSSLSGFTYIPPQISISSFSPTSGTQGTQILIRGHGFLGAQTVSFGGVAASSINTYGDTSIVAVVSTGASGNVTVSGTNGADAQTGFTYSAYTPPPSNTITLASFKPSSGRTGDTVYISGTHMTSANTVSFGGAPALFYKALSDSQLMAVIGAGATGAVKVANSTSSDSLRLFTFLYDSTKLTQPGAFQLIQFSGSLAGNNNPQLQWQVRNDAGIAYYAVERSTDSTQFIIISTVKSTRSNGNSHTYSFSDLSPGSGVSWYRLKMQDTTASYSYSQKVKLQPASQMMPVYPNPARYGFFLVDLPDINGPSQFRLYDMSGKQLQNIKVAAGTSQVRIDVPGLPNGTYRLIWTNGRSSAFRTILILPK